MGKPPYICFTAKITDFIPNPPSFAPQNPPPLPKEANAAESRGAGLLLILSANKTKSGVSEDTPPAIQLNSCANSIK